MAYRSLHVGALLYIPFPTATKPFLKINKSRSHRTFPIPFRHRPAPKRQQKHDSHPKSMRSSSSRHYLLLSTSCPAPWHARPRPKTPVSRLGSGCCCVRTGLGDGRSATSHDRSAPSDEWTTANDERHATDYGVSATSYGTIKSGRCVGLAAWDGWWNTWWNGWRSTKGRR